MLQQTQQQVIVASLIPSSQQASLRKQGVNSNSKLAMQILLPLSKQIHFTITIVRQNGKESSMNHSLDGT